MNDRSHELHPLQHALRQILTLLAHRVCQAEAAQQLGRTSLHLFTRPRLEPSDVGQKGADLHLAVDAPLLRQIADAVLGLQRRWLAQHAQRARIRKQDRHDHPDRCRLAGAAGTDQAVGRASGYCQVQIVDGPHTAEGLVDAAKLESNVHSGPHYIGLNRYWNALLTGSTSVRPLTRSCNFPSALASIR